MYISTLATNREKNEYNSIENGLWNKSFKKFDDTRYSRQITAFNEIKEKL